MGEVPAAPLHLADQIKAGGDVAPLVRATDLHGAPASAVELDEVIRLNHHVAELGIGDPLPQ